MARSKKPNKVVYGIEITKPHSKEMYGHNELVSEEMKMNILDAWRKALTRLNANLTKDDLKDLNWDEDAFNNESNEISNPILVQLQRSICAYGYGDGYSVQDVNDEFESVLENMPNYALHEEYSYLFFKGQVPSTHFMMLGFGYEEGTAGTPIQYDYTNVNELSPFSPLSLPHISL